LIEGWALFDSLYMTIITMTTIGYREIHPLSKAGRIFNLTLIVFGVSVAAFTANYLIRFVLEGEIQEAMGRRRMAKIIKQLKDHYVICGYGRMGRIICKEFASSGVPLVIIEKEPVELDADDDTPVIIGDATRDETLKEAMLEYAKGLISVLSTDADNLYVVLSARGINPGLKIVARAGEDGAEQKLLRAGADNVISPYSIGGQRIAHSILKPFVVDFIDFATKSGNLELQIEEVPVQDGSRLAGLTIDESRIGKELGIIIVAIQKAGDMKFNPTHKTVINAGDTLIALGEKNRLKALETAAQGTRHST